MTELSRYLFSPLREGDLTFLRGSGDGLAPILLVTGDDSSLGSLKRLQHEYALKAELDAVGAARPAALSHLNGRLTLVIEDPGGEPLDLLLSGPMDVTEFLHVAIPLAGALHRVHERGLIHKDIKPSNVLVNLASGGVWLTGFGIASRLPREHRAPEPPEMIAGTLAYMAPEQTGRMNRSVDSRSDLYSLGITFYEMLTGTLPFAATDPMEWVHCHIARQVDPPDERAKEIPEVLSSIVMRLLAKTAEERYQTAWGVEADLRRCLSEWELHGCIDRFPLGARDASDRLLIPEKLYGREREIDILLAAFDRVVAQGTIELVLVSGYSGIGKSSVVNELHKVLVPRRGLFASGKFDQYKRDIPYATLAQAFQSLVHLLLGKSEAELGFWRETLREALGPNGQLMVNLVPELELVIGKQPPVADLSPQETQKRFQTVVRKFVSVFARPEHPLALFLDDLQWLDAGTLDVLTHLVTHPEVRHLLLVGAYRDNQVHPSDPLMRTLDEIRKSKAKVCDIVLAPLGLHDVEQLVVDSFHSEREHTRSLSQLVREKTAGNPFFVIQFISALAEDGLIAFDRSSATWNWDLTRIRAKGFTDNVVDLMVGKLSRLPGRTQDVLKLFACLGNTAEITTLAMVRGEPEVAIDSHLRAAVRVGLVLRLERSYTFLHDRVQEAAYSLIPVDQRATLHLRIGGCLVAGMSNEKLTEHIFDVVKHFSHGVALISDPDERELAADLNFRAGKKAKASTAYASAVHYFTAGTALLGPSGWAKRYDLAFGLTLERAECLFFSNQFDETERLISALLRRAASTVDKAAAYRLKIELHVVKSENPKAVESALECLHLFGIDMPAHPSRDEVQAEYEKIWRNLGDRSIESLIDLPIATAPEPHASMRVLAALMPPAYYTDINLDYLAICRMVNLSLVHGVTDATTNGFGWFGWILCGAFQRYDEGYRFGKLALDFVQSRGFANDATRVHYALGVIVTWTKPLATSIDLFRTGFRISVETGDLIIAACSAREIIIRLIHTGVALGEVWHESEAFLDFARKIGFSDGIDMIVSQQRFVAALRGRTARLSTYSDAEFDETAFEAALTADRMTTMVCRYWILKIGARFLSGDYGQALEAVEKAKPLIWSTSGEIQLLDYHFYSALTLASLTATDLSDERRMHIIEHRDQLREWAQNNPGNFGSASALVEAEIARIENRALDAMDLYDEAIRAAREQGFIQTEGVANESAARFYSVRGLETIAHTYLRNARSCYFRWGADGKVRQLEKLHPHLREKPIPASTATTFGVPIEQLDVGAVVKASQALSSEIVLDKLIESLMRIAIEHAGADRGVLIIPTGDEQRIEAEATTCRDGIEVRLSGKAVIASEFPVSILQYVARTVESVILDDASVHNPFLADEYMRHRRCRSVLCLPLIKQSKIIGALYLENSCASHVFTPAKAALLKLLASQAAISIENAQLYANLQKAELSVRQAESELRLLIDAIPGAAWSALPDGSNDFVNRGWVEYTNLPLEDTKGSGWSAVVHPDELDSYWDHWRIAVASGEPFDAEVRFRRADGQYRWFLVRSLPLRDELGNIIKWYGTCTDIEDRKRAEALQAELARMSRLTTMGELTASIAHEIIQPLSAIVTNGNTCLHWLEDRNIDLAKARSSATNAVRDAERAGDIIRRIRALMTKSETHKVEIDLNHVIGEVLALTHNELLKRQISVHTELALPLPPVLGDRVQLQQLMLNLIMNCVEAMATVVGRPKELSVETQVHSTGCVLTLVRDTGVGLDWDNSDKLFDAFFTTKPEGTGMGLAICRSIVEAHGGHIWASQRVPDGAVFQFTLPRRGYDEEPVVVERMEVEPQDS